MCHHAKTNTESSNSNYTLHPTAKIFFTLVASNELYMQVSSNSNYTLHPTAKIFSLL